MFYQSKLGHKDWLKWFIARKKKGEIRRKENRSNSQLQFRLYACNKLTWNHIQNACHCNHLGSIAGIAACIHLPWSEQGSNNSLMFSATQIGCNDLTRRSATKQFVRLLNNVYSNSRMRPATHPTRRFLALYFHLQTESINLCNLINMRYYGLFIQCFSKAVVINVEPFF